MAFAAKKTKALNAETLRAQRKSEKAEKILIKRIQQPINRPI